MRANDSGSGRVRITQHGGATVVLRATDRRFVALHDDEPHLESDEERLQRQIRARLDQHVTDARAVIGATKVRVASHERAGRRQRLRQLAGFGVLTFGVWGLAATMNVFPHALATVSVSPMAGMAVVTAAALIGLGTYLLWTAVRRHV